MDKSGIDIEKKKQTFFFLTSITPLNCALTIRIFAEQCLQS